MRCAVYFRVSTKAQGEDDKYGLAKQQEQVDSFLAEEGHVVVGEPFVDIGYSGATIDRPDLSRMLTARGFDAVVVPRWDRLGRETILIGWLRFEFKKRGIRVLSATEGNALDPISDLTQTILAAVGTYERSLIAQRMLGGRRIKAAGGGYACGTAPYGTQAKRKTGVLLRNPAEYDVLLRMQTMRADGATLRRIASALNADGVLSRSGRQWSATTVRGALLSAHRAAAVAA